MPHDAAMEARVGSMLENHMVIGDATPPESPRYDDVLADIRSGADDELAEWLYAHPDTAAEIALLTIRTRLLDRTHPQSRPVAAKLAHEADTALDAYLSDVHNLG